MPRSGATESLAKRDERSQWGEGKRPAVVHPYPFSLQFLNVEDDLGVELPEVLSVVNSAEVFVVMFAMFERRLLVDARTGSEGPLIRVVDRVRNSDERFRELQRMRPRFPAPDRIVAFPWPRSIRTFVECGVWDAIQQRMISLGAAENTCLAVIAELRQEERKEEIRAVKGEEPYQTMRGTGIS